MANLAVLAGGAANAQRERDESMRRPLTNESQYRTPDASPTRANSTPMGLLRENSASINRNQDGTLQQAISMQWSDLSFSIGNKKILSNLTGRVNSGCLTGILGPSGSGKSTLLNVLAGRQRTDAPGMQLTGQICIGGTPIRPVEYRSNIAYVMQDDSLMATETPRECLRFSAYLRLPPTAGNSRNHEDFVKIILSTLQLNKCADTIVGSALVKGISGGERKRTSVGIELITNPNMIFLDEPLSGLDSYAAYTLVVALKELAAAGVLVVCSVHQPSSEIFDLFEEAIFLHDGQAAYHGPVKQLSEHFASVGYPCKASFNPADHVMFLLQKESTESVDAVKQKWADSALQAAITQDIEQARNRSAGSGLTVPTRQGSGVGFFRKLAVLLRREFRGTLRNKGILASRFGMSLFLGSLYAWLFAGSASGGDDPNSTKNNCVTEHFDFANCSADFQAHYGTLVSLSIMAMMGSAQPVLLSFPAERPVFLREYAAKQYSVAPYFISKTLVEMPVVLVGQIITFLVAYFIMGLHGNFLYEILVTFGLGIASSSLALLIGCGVASAQKAIQLAPLTLIPQMLFSGLFLPVQKIPASLRWVKYICPLRYAINLLTHIEFSYIKDRLDDCVLPACNPMKELPGDVLRNNLIKSQGVEWSDFTFDLGILAALYVGFRLIAACLLWRKGKYVY